MQSINDISYVRIACCGDEPEEFKKLTVPEKIANMDAYRSSSNNALAAEINQYTTASARSNKCVLNGIIFNAAKNYSIARLLAIGDLLGIHVHEVMTDAIANYLTDIYYIPQTPLQTPSGLYTPIGFSLPQAQVPVLNAISTDSKQELKQIAEKIKQERDAIPALDIETFPLLSPAAKVSKTLVKPKSPTKSPTKLLTKTNIIEVVKPTIELSELIKPTSEVVEVVKPVGELIKPTSEVVEVVKPTSEVSEIVKPTSEVVEVVKPTSEVVEVVKPTSVVSEIVKPTVELSEIVKPTSEAIKPEMELKKYAWGDSFEPTAVSWLEMIKRHNEPVIKLFNSPTNANNKTVEKKHRHFKRRAFRNFDDSPKRQQKQNENFRTVTSAGWYFFRENPPVREENDSFLHAARSDGYPKRWFWDAEKQHYIVKGVPIAHCPTEINGQITWKHYDIYEENGVEQFKLITNMEYLRWMLTPRADRNYDQMPDPKHGETITF